MTCRIPLTLLTLSLSAPAALISIARSGRCFRIPVSRATGPTGDLLPNATRDQIIATGFNRNRRLNGEGGRIVEEWFAENVIDRVETTGLTWMALTFNCCRCHDHKYDPITQKEFYQLFTAPLPAGTFTGVMLHTLPDPSLPGESVGRYLNGNVVLSDIDAEITVPGMKEPLEAQF